MIFQLLSDSGKGCDHVNRWLFLGKSARSDRFLEPGVRNKLFLDKNGNSFDLASLNIQVRLYLYQTMQM